MNLHLEARTSLAKHLPNSIAILIVAPSPHTLLYKPQQPLDQCPSKSYNRYLPPFTQQLRSRITNHKVARLSTLD